jgi:molybdopterin synthase catalytic subunit
MRVTVRTFASLRDLSIDREELELPDGATIAASWDVLAARYPGLGPQRPYVRAARNGMYAAWDDVLADGDVVALLPPVSGGGPQITSEPIDVPALEASVRRPGFGAVVTFVGAARDVADDGRRVVELEYEVYAEMAESVLAAIADEARERFGVAVAVVHRHGPVPIGDAAVAIATASVHRADAYDANRYVIEAVKERLPIWKRERFEDGSEWKRPGA